MAVKTGLSLLFALLRQSWQQNAMPGIVSFMVTCFADAQTLQFIFFFSFLSRKHWNLNYSTVVPWHVDLFLKLFLFAVHDGVQY
jgi:hypothetical protein